MTLRKRIAQLEARPGTAGNADEVVQDTAAFGRRMARLGPRIEAAGEFSDALKAPSAERCCRALLRGDGEAAQAIMGKATEGTA